MARVAQIVGATIDLWGDKWDVRERRATAHGFSVAIGWPHGLPRGKAGTGGPRVIVTPDLAAHLQAVSDRPGAHGLPIGNTAVKRLRRLLGLDWRDDRAAWWAARADDLADLTVEEFGRRHGASAGAIINARHALFGPTSRPAGWWRAPDVQELILADRPRALIAENLGLSVGAIGRLRYVLRARVTDQNSETSAAGSGHLPS
ncbi:hypothetical protein [Ancylobacter sp.]|uniref:hypothetical protein n=1 Tax=Ancylobacter sp. TaxID=1872567 RepID=UPI003D0E03EA